MMQEEDSLHFFHRLIMKLVSLLGIWEKKRTIRMQSTRDVTIRVQSVNKLHGYLNIGDNGTVYFAYQRS